jgi:hypothetical protein
MSRHLFEPITDSGIRNAHFFNGRLLTAEDLAAVLGATRDHDRQLGQGVGEGIIHGLEVEPASSTTQTHPVVRVSGGLALNRGGGAVALAVPTTDVALVRAPATFAPEAGVFAECQLPEPPNNLSNLGIYVFVASPASTYDGAVPTRHSVTTDKFDGCGKRYAVEGIKFRMERIDFTTLSGVGAATLTALNGLTAQSDDAAVSKLRSIVAHLCFDTEEATAATAANRLRDPFKRLAGDATYVNYGALSELHTRGQLTDCDVPLALIYWSPQGVRFVDNWAVRRLARRVLDLDVLSLLRSYGYERLLQFERHLQDLFDGLGTLSTAVLQNYFAFVPPVGYYPVSGSKSPRGFHPVNFFKQFTTAPGQPGDITSDRFGALLRESFVCPDVDLGPRPVFQTYRVRDNARAVAASNASSQLYQVFVSRSLNGPLARDGVAKTFSDAWEVYRSLIKRRAFLPSGLDEEKFTAQADITTVIRDVLDMSNRQAALAGGWALDTTAALEAFQDMYRVQKELTTLFRSNIPGIIHTQGRETFGQAIDRFLDVMILDGSPGLLPSIQAADLFGAVKAQNQINNYVGTYTGGGDVARGPFGFRYLESPRGLHVVPPTAGITPRPPLPHNFAVINHTDKRITIGLEAGVSAPHGGWDNSVRIQDANQHDITEITLNSGTEGNIVVLVTAPSNAHIGETAVLALAANVPPPTDRTTRTTLNLDVAATEGAAVTTRVAFDGNVTRTVADPNNAPASDFMSYFYNLVYSSADGPPSADFEFIVTLTPSPAAAWTVEFQGVAARHTAGTNVYSRDVTLTKSGPNSVEVIIGTPPRASVDRSATFTVSARSKTQPNEVNAQHPDAFSLTVKAG